MRMIRTLVIVAFASALICGVAFAEETVIARARAAFSAGRTADALQLLESHLAESPNDVDARLTYGLILSWDGRYQQAKSELGRVLETAPGYRDARVALMNVYWWAGETAAARDLSSQLLAEDPSQPQAKLIRDRLDAQSKPWTATAWYSSDTFNDADAWHETSLALGRQTPIGSFIVRGTNAARFGYTDQLVELEAYPRFRAGTYGFVSVGGAAKEQLYPGYRLAFDLYQSVGRGVEVSGGYRRLAFANPVHIYIGTVTRYVGTWAVTGKTFFVPSIQHDSWSFHAETRRYMGSAGRSFVGLTASHGMWREEPRGLGDLVSLRSDSFRGQTDLEVSRAMRVLLNGGVSRQERALRNAQWQTTLSAGAAWRF